MERAVLGRVMMAALGGMGGLAVYGLSELDRFGVLGETALLLLATFCTSFFTGLLAMLGPLVLRRAAMGAAAIAAFVTLVMAFGSISFVDIEAMFYSPHSVLAVFALTFLLMPFWIAASGPGWRDYPTLFSQAWSVVIRYAAAWAFVGLAWAVLFLCDTLLSSVGIGVINNLLALDPAPYLLTGALLGLALAVVQEYGDYLTPYLILRLLRLLLPVVLLVSLIFLVALPLQEVRSVFGGMSFAMTLLSMAGAGVTLITAAVDQSDEEAVESRWQQVAAKAMSVVVIALALVAGWALGQRVSQYGWTPDRVFAAEVALIAFGYGLLYCMALARRKAWMEGIRQANIIMALVIGAVLTLAMTPILNAERISTASLMARLEDGRQPIETFNPRVLKSWGAAGQNALLRLGEKGKEPGQEALAQALAGLDRAKPAAEVDIAALQEELRRIMPLQPDFATATRDIYLDVLDSGRLSGLRQSCLRVMPSGGPGCVMVVGDLLPRAPGEEAMIVEYFAGGFVSYTGFRMDGPAGPGMVDVQVVGESLPQFEAGEALIRSWQDMPPAAVAVPLNQFDLPDGGGLLLLP